MYEFLSLEYTVAVNNALSGIPVRSNRKAKKKAKRKKKKKN